MGLGWGTSDLALRLNLAAATAFALVLLGLAIGYGYTRWGADRRAAFWVDHTHQVIETSLILFPEMQDVSASEQRFLLSNGGEPLDEYRQAVAAIRTSEAKLANLVADNPAQARRVVKLRASLDAWLNARQQLFSLGEAGQAFACQRPRLGCVHDVLEGTGHEHASHGGVAR